MSLVIGAVLTDRVVLMADSLTVSGGMRVANHPKLRLWYGYIVGTVGGSAEEYAYFFALPLDTVLEDPWRHRERITFCRERWKQPDNADFNWEAYATKNGRLFYLSNSGAVSEESGIGAIGEWQQAEGLLREAWRPEMSLASTLAVGDKVIRAVSSEVLSVRPPMQWIDTIDRVVLVYDA